MFGLFKKRIPAPEHQRQKLVKQMFLHRCESDADAKMQAMMIEEDISAIPAELLMQGMPEATVLSIVEQFYTLRDQGATDEFAVKTLNEMHASLLSMAGEDLPKLGHAATLYQYARHVTTVLHGHGLGYADEFLIDAIQQVKDFYKR